MHEKYSLSNGADVILVPQHDTKSVTILIMYPVGSRYEPEKLSGVSHYIEHLMFKGTKKRKNTLILTREIDRLGAEYNAFTGKESTGYYIKVDAEYTKIALDILSDMLFHSVFDPKEMEREKGPIIEELRMYKDNPLMNIENIFEDLLYAGCPLGRDIGGTERHVASFARNQVLAYRDKYYTPRNITIVIAGNMGDQIRAWVDAYIAAEPRPSTSPARAFAAAAFGSADLARRVVVQEKKTDQVQLMLGFPGFPYVAKENPAVSVMSTVLGGSMSSRLFIQIRERRGLAYMIRSGEEHFRDAGHVYVRAGLEAKNVGKALKVIKQEIAKLVDKGVTARELRDAKTHIHGALMLGMEDSSVQANWYAREALFYPKIETPEEWLRTIDAVTNEEIRAVAGKIFKLSEMRVAVIGDVTTEQVRESL
ncbi:MAG: insulinase family protein [Candidatus Magasanikbacteria bacterium]|nr:insulinase family protein [Candidatus Magasanikbacteria bacterium]